MTIREDLEAICAVNAFMQYNHIRLGQVEPDRVTMELTVEEEHLNPYGFIHGGALFTMADNACGMAARTDGRQYVTQSSAFTFLHSGVLGDTICMEGKVRRRGKTTCFVEANATNQAGELLASGSFTFYCIG
jgi:acyl-CoA thioesterase